MKEVLAALGDVPTSEERRAEGRSEGRAATFNVVK